jgi:hypothetical protein
MTKKKATPKDKKLPLGLKPADILKAVTLPDMGGKLLVVTLGHIGKEDAMSILPELNDLKDLSELCGDVIAGLPEKDRPAGTLFYPPMVKFEVVKIAPDDTVLLFIGDPKLGIYPSKKDVADNVARVKKSVPKGVRVIPVTPGVEPTILSASLGAKMIPATKEKKKQ